jgi:hypothetical protein
MRKLNALPGLFAGIVLLSLPAVSSAGVFLSVSIAPPVLQVYQQPICPVDGYLWTPGYWGYRNAGYYWIPGAWLAPPQSGFLWTPGYWGFSGGLYSFNAGYWGPTVGFYGGVNYGFGYGGSGFDGGRWQGGHFAYNTAVSRVNTTVIHNTYNQTVVNRGNNRTSFNGPGGIAATPSSAEAATARQHNQSASAPAGRQQSPFAGQATAANHERPANTAARATPVAVQQPQARQAATARPAPQQPERTAPQQQSHVAPQEQQPHVAPQQQRPQATHAAAPERAAARPAAGREERR